MTYLYLVTFYHHEHGEFWVYVRAYSERRAREIATEWILNRLQINSGLLQSDTRVSNTSVAAMRAVIHARCNSNPNYDEHMNLVYSRPAFGASV
jgi:hypothetical protein